MIRCKIFGHKKPTGYASDVPYGKLSWFYTDHIGRVHCRVELECERCNKHYEIAKVHLPSFVFLSELDKDPTLTLVNWKKSLKS